MLRHLTKTVTAGVLAVTLAATGLTATATPAAANDHRNGAEAAAVIGGLLLLYGIANANNRNNHGGGTIRLHNHPQPRHQPHNLRVAPQRCFIQGSDNYGHFRGYRYRCMQRHAAAPHLLPQNCLRHVWTHQGQRTIYTGRCLRNHGWTRG